MLPRADWSQQINPPYVAPRTKLEREVQLLWQTVLNRRSMISVEADFTQQGGGMMHAVVVNGIIRSVSQGPAPCLLHRHSRISRTPTAQCITSDASCLPL